MDEKSTLKHLKSVLDANNIQNYAISDTADWCVCLNKVDGRWQTCMVDRGIPFDVRQFNSLDEGCYALILQLAENEYQRTKMVNEFSASILPDLKMA